MSLYPFLFPFLSEERWLSFGKNCLNWNEDDCLLAKHHISAKRIPLLNGLEIASYLGVSKELIQAMALQSHRFYNTFSVKKKNGGERSIAAPRVFLKVIQRYILDCILSPTPPHEASFGFVRGRNPGMGAEMHINRPFLWNIDLQDFFPSISQSRVRDFFFSLGYPPVASRTLSSLCCLNGWLPQGAPTSPAIANGVFLKGDIEIQSLCSEKNIVYSRYADDLSFSSLTAIDDDFRKAVAEIIRKYGFSINAKKTRLTGPKCRREVTGLTVNTRVSIPREKRRAIRAQFHNLNGKILLPEEQLRLCGLANWVSLHHEEGKRYLQQLREIRDKGGQKSS